MSQFNKLILYFTAMSILAGLAGFFISEQIYWLSAILLVVVIWLILKLKNHYQQTNRNVLYFLSSLKNGDFTTKFTTKNNDSLSEINSELNRIIAEFKEIDREKEENYHFVKFVIDHLDVALVAYDSEEKVHLANSFSLKLFNLNDLYRIDQIRNFSDKLYKSLKIDEKHQTIEIPSLSEHYYFLVSRSTIFLNGKLLQLALIQNISSELESKEFEAHNSLIRILTHEIMNSIAPITSLAETSNQLAKKLFADNQSEEQEDILAALQAIEKRGNGLLSFIQSYRDLNSLPAPNFKILKLSDLLSNVINLFKNDLKQITLTQNINPNVSSILGDHQLLEQVLINLFKNALDALKNVSNPQIIVEINTNNQLRPEIRLTDNGCGISEEVLSKIFMPFFSTKTGGSGIGLTLCRQIMKMHKGTISAFSDGKEQTVFILSF